MARELIDIILRLRKEGTGIRDTTDELKGLEKTSDKAKAGFEGIGSALGKVAGVAGAAAGALYTLKKAYDFAKEGAAIAQTAESFDRLMSSMGAGPDVLQKLQSASRGTVDDMTLMSSTMTLLAGTSQELGMAMVDAAPRLMEIAKAANKLNPALGTTSEMYNSISVGVKRAQPLILDNLGLTLKVGQANEDFAKSIGKTVEQLTAEEKSMAILAATLEAGDRMIEQVGGSTEAMGDSFAEAETEISNAMDTLKTKASPIMAEVVGFLADMVTGMDKTAEAAEGIRKSTDAYDDYLDAALAAAQANHWLSKSEVELIKRQAEAGEEFHRTVTAVGILTEEQWGLAKETDRVSEKWEAYAAALRATPVRELTEDTEDLAGNVELLASMMSDRAARAADDFKTSLDLLHIAIRGDFGEAVEEFGQNMDDLAAKMEELVAKEKELAGQPLVTDSQRDRLTDLSGDIATATGKLQEAKDAYAELMEEGADEEKLGKAQENIDKLQGKLDELNTKVGRTWRDISKATRDELKDVRDEIDETAAAIDEESEAFYRNTREVMFNIAEKQILDALEKGLIEDVNKSGTAYDEATTALWTMAAQMGLVDDATLEMMKSTQDTTQAFIDGKIEAGLLGTTLADAAWQARDAALGMGELKSGIEQIPSYKKFVFETHYKTTGTPTYGGEGGPGYTPPAPPEYYQHGGQFLVRGPAGPDRVPVNFMATRGEVVTVTPVGGQAPPNPVTNNNYNLTLNSAAASQGVIRDFNIMQAMVS